MANYSYTVQRDYVFDNIKTQRAYQSLKSLPFVDTTIQSSLYKLLNAPNIELDRLRDSIRDSSLSVNPAIANFSLPASLYLTQVSIENYSEEGLHKKEQLHFGAPTSFSSGTESTFDLEYDILDNGVSGIFKLGRPNISTNILKITVIMRTINIH